MKYSKKLRNLKKFLSTKFVFILLLLIFSIYSLFIAFHLETGIAPDEHRHFTFAKHFATVWGIPQDTYKTYSLGWYIYNNPFLFHWINGRVINLIDFIKPESSDRQILIALRLTNSFYTIGTVLFCYLLSMEIIPNKWCQLLPVFLLTNTIMFVFLSGGLNYDNITSLLCMAGLFYLIRVFKKNKFIENSLTWMICIALATLVKFAILAIALPMTLSWLVFVFIHRKDIFPLKINQITQYALITAVIMLLIGNFAIYGMNLIRYGSLTTPCREILTDAQCRISPFAALYQKRALDSKLTVLESIQLGYPSPLKYVTWTWLREMLRFTFGILGHETYIAGKLIKFYQLLIYWIIFLGCVNVIYWRKVPFIESNLLFIALFYTTALLIRNYNYDLVMGFRLYAIHGRYIFPVIGAIYILAVQIIRKIPSRVIKTLTLVYIMLLFFYGGPLSFILKFESVFKDWFF